MVETESNNYSIPEKRSEIQKEPETLRAKPEKMEQRKKKPSLKEIVENSIQLGLIKMDETHNREKLHGDSVDSFITSAKKYEASKDRKTYLLEDCGGIAYLGDAPLNEIIACCTTATMLKMMIIAEDYAREGREDESYVLLNHAFYFFHEGNKIKHEYGFSKVKENEIREIYLAIKDMATTYAGNLSETESSDAKILARRFFDFARECEEALGQIKELQEEK